MFIISLKFLFKVSFFDFTHIDLINMEEKLKEKDGMQTNLMLSTLPPFFFF